ncbi:hypothetical protein BJ546DRAFT_999818 [Cryomyces antarcticus]|uniref:DNA-directed RNA polymerase subunit n=1 Tax=Cryomyces antarcticus TaxID=329879 RepID=A0ABR0M9C4_9PEZI|nr:RNA polymerase III C11 subunit [Cryomyces antarcticus]KAK5019705.1 RNA polymerase III C11 subunit [Cryomyces antarcticus]KAK5296676.1 RNA polymerase III C11 subunit [Cryomyces antarcticus]
MLTVSRVPSDTTIDIHLANRNRFECRTCPYQMVLDRRYYERKNMKRKEVEDVLGGEESWANVNTTEVPCDNDKCDGRSAYYYQLQIRSADEPMTTFYKCVKCARQWRE